MECLMFKFFICYEVIRMTLCYVGTLAEVTLINSQIDANCGFPNSKVNTWSVPQQLFGQSLWFIPVPLGMKLEDGTSFTTQQMISGVVEITKLTSDISWFPSVDQLSS